MKRSLENRLQSRYPPSPPCECDRCRLYCVRPGWWTPAEARRAFDAGLGPRMMLEVAPELTFGVLSPAFKGCEGGFALQESAGAGCTFLAERRCELHATAHQPLECRFCHHDRTGLGPACHRDIEKVWRGDAGRSLVRRWMASARLVERYGPLVPPALLR